MNRLSLPYLHLKAILNEHKYTDAERVTYMITNNILA